MGQRTEVHIQRIINRPGWHCIRCSLKPKGGWYKDFHCLTTREMLVHAKQHILAQHVIPKYTFNTLQELE